MDRADLSSPQEATKPRQAHTNRIRNHLHTGRYQSSLITSPECQPNPGQSQLDKRFVVVATLNNGTTRAVGNPSAGIFPSRKAALRARERLVSQLASWAANSDPDELDAA